MRPRELREAARRIGRTAKRPLIVHMVANNVLSDSRVLKCARLSSDLGFGTVILGIDGSRNLTSWAGIPLVRVPVSRRFQSVAVAADRNRRKLADELDNWEASREAAVRRLTVSAGVGQRGTLMSRIRSRGKAPQFDPIPLPGDGLSNPWWVKRPHVVDIEIAFEPILRALRPDVMHAHDIIPLPIAAHHAATRRSQGERVEVVYDAHEYLAGLAQDNPETWSPYHEIERSYVRGARAVVTVSARMAELLAAQYELATVPTVVTNAPPQSDDPDSVPRLRDVVGLDAGTPLMVYSGWIDSGRGVDLAVAALTEIPQAHLALVVGRRSPDLTMLLAQARNAGVAGRVHVTGYVRPEDVTSYVASADVGLIPLAARPGYEVSLPTKFREYLLAGLPIVVSDNRQMAEFTLRTGVGEVFPSGDVAGFVAAVRKVLDNRDFYRQRITPRVTEGLSWSDQVPALRKVYQNLAGTEPRSAESQSRPPRFAEIAAGPPTPARLRRVGVHLAIGPANYAGQAFAWSRAVTRELGIPATSFGRPGPWSFDVHRPFYPSSPQGLAEQIAFLLRSPTHLVLETFKTVLGPLTDADFKAELRAFDRLGFQMALAVHGSEIRDPDRHMDRIPSSYYRDAPSDYVESHRALTRRSREIIDGSGLPVFLSTPDLLLDVPEGRWLPATVDVEQWVVESPALESEVPVVLHLPSLAEPPIKGTAIIDPVLNALADSGRIGYRRPESVAHGQVRELVKDCDILVDQVLTGSYGVAAIEGMAAGRLVVGYVADDVKALMPQPPPVVDAPGPRFADVMWEILDDLPRFRALAAEGPAFAKRWHDGTEAAAALEPFLDLPPQR